MKKFLLSLVLLAFAGIASAQITFERIVNHENVGEVAPGRYEIIGNIDDAYELTFAMNVINNGENAVSITCEKTVISITEGAGNNFCLGAEGVIGLEYQLPINFPLAISLDYRPALNVLPGLNPNFVNFGFGIKYCF